MNEGLKYDREEKKTSTPGQAQERLKCRFRQISVSNQFKIKCLGTSLVRSEYGSHWVRGGGRGEREKVFPLLSVRFNKTLWSGKDFMINLRNLEHRWENGIEVIIGIKQETETGNIYLDTNHSITYISGFKIPTELVD